MGFSGYSATPKGFGKTKHCDMGDTPVDPVIPILFVDIKAVSGSTFQQKQHFWIVSQSWRVNSILVGQIQLFAGEIHDFCWLNS
jgi:hypothetical protein